MFETSPTRMNLNKPPSRSFSRALGFVCRAPRFIWLFIRLRRNFFYIFLFQLFLYIYFRQKEGGDSLWKTTPVSHSLFLYSLFSFSLFEVYIKRTISITAFFFIPSPFAFFYPSASSTKGITYRALSCWENS